MLAEALEGVRRFAAEYGRLAMSTELLADQADAVLAEVWRALGPVPELLWGEAAAEARAQRPELSAQDPDRVLAVPPGTVLYAPVTVQRRRVTQMEALGVPDVILDGERARLAELEAEPFVPPAWDRVFVLADQLAQWPGYTRRGALSIEVARHVLPAWTFDDAPARLLDDAVYALTTGRGAQCLELRDQLAARSYEVEGAAHAAVRAAVQAHDRVTQNPGRDDQTELEYLAEHAWPGPASEFAAWWCESALRIARSH